MNRGASPASMAPEADPIFESASDRWARGSASAALLLLVAALLFLGFSPNPSRPDPLAESGFDSPSAGQTGPIKELLP